MEKQGGEAVGQANRTDLSIYRRKYDERLREKKGLSTSEVADHLAIQRSNASKDLNKLVKEGRVEKSDSRPVRYWAAGVDPSSREKYVPSYKESRPQREKAFLNGYKENPLTEIFCDDHRCQRKYEKCR